MDKIRIKDLVRLALREDIPKGDITTNSIVPLNDRATARIFVKETSVVCGLDFVSMVFKQLDPKVRLHFHIKDGQKAHKNTTILTIHGRTRAILTGERTALNFLSYLSAIATKTHLFVEKIHPYKSQILDTRKTTPTLRSLERYAVRCGGGTNHRDNLSEAVMIKDNHWSTLPKNSLFKTIDRIKHQHKVPVIVEVDNLVQLKEILQSKADVILLDNMTPAIIRKAVAMRKKINSRILFEVSGGVTIHNVRTFASTGIERISVGGLTHSREAIDFSLEITK